MVSKQARWARIRELLEAQRIDTQETLATALAGRGIEVSQSTLSKDLREMGVLRVPRPEGGFQYMIPKAGASLHDRRILERELRDYLISMRAAQNILVLSTAAGHAQSVCEAVDQMGWEEIIGTLAGENTIFVATGSSADAAALQGRIATVLDAVP